MLSIDYITTREAAAIVGVSESRIRQMRIAGDLKAEKLDARTWIMRRDEAERVASERRKRQNGTNQN